MTAATAPTPVAAEAAPMGEREAMYHGFAEAARASADREYLENARTKHLTAAQSWDALAQLAKQVDDGRKAQRTAVAAPAPDDQIG